MNRFTKSSPMYSGVYVVARDMIVWKGVFRAAKDGGFHYPSVRNRCVAKCILPRGARVVVSGGKMRTDCLIPIYFSGSQNVKSRLTLNIHCSVLEKNYNYRYVIGKKCRPASDFCADSKIACASGLYFCTTRKGAESYA